MRTVMLGGLLLVFVGAVVVATMKSTASAPAGAVTDTLTIAEAPVRPGTFRVTRRATPSPAPATVARASGAVLPGETATRFTPESTLASGQLPEAYGAFGNRRRDGARPDAFGGRTRALRANSAGGGGVGAPGLSVGGGGRVSGGSGSSDSGTASSASATRERNTGTGKREVTSSTPPVRQAPPVSSGGGSRSSGGSGSNDGGGGSSTDGGGSGGSSDGARAAAVVAGASAGSAGAGSAGSAGAASAPLPAGLVGGSDDPFGGQAPPPAPTPEPATMLLLATGLGGLYKLRRHLE